GAVEEGLRQALPPRPRAHALDRRALPPRTRIAGRALRRSARARWTARPRLARAQAALGRDAPALRLAPRAGAGGRACSTDPDDGRQLHSHARQPDAPGRRSRAGGRPVRFPRPPVRLVESPLQRRQIAVTPTVWTPVLEGEAALRAASVVREI